MIVGTNDIFEKEVLKSKQLILVDFWAPWCGPCRMLSPIVEKLSGDVQYNGKVGFVKVNVDEQPDLAGQFSIMSIPTLMLFKGGRPKDAKIGTAPEGDLRDWIQKNL